MNIPPNQTVPNKNVSVVVTFEQGNFDEGFPVVAQVFEDGVPGEKWKRRWISGVPRLQELYDNWKKHYIQQATRIVLPAAPINFSNIEAFRGAAYKLLEYLREQWFDSLQFQVLKEWIKGCPKVRTDPSVPIFFEFDTQSREQNTLLRRLPWSHWDLFRELPNAEATLGLAFRQPVISTLRDLKILAIFGSDEGGINLEADLKFVSELKQFGAEINDLSCPEPEKLYSNLRHNSYDVLFFAGHSLSTDEQRSGEILLQPKTPVSLEKLRPCLQTAAHNGLKLAIFNSCDGLGLADLLVTEAKIPAVVVFKEPVPDEVACRFLQYFLEEFSKGTPLFRSVREARNKLQFLEDRSENPLPCASWLPVVCQNPSQSEFVWVQKIEQKPSQSSPNLEPKLDPKPQNWRWKIVRAMLALALLTTLVVALEKLKSLIDPKTPESGLITDVLVSQGDKLVIRQETNDAKILGIEAYDAGNWDEAIAAFRKSLNQELEDNKKSNIKDSLDPETWIYLNNAIAEKKAALNLGQLVELAISVPAKDRPGEQILSKELLYGAALRQAEFNCGVEKLITAIEDLEQSLNCVSEDENQFVHVTIANDLANEETAKNVAIELSEKSIVGVIGHFSSDSCIEAGKIYKQHEIVMISPTCTSTSIQSALESSSYFFRTVPNDADAAKSIWSRVEKPNTEVAIAYSRNSEYSESFKNAFEAEIPTQDYRYICDELEDNFSPPRCAEKAKEEGANFLLLVPTTTTTLNAALGILTHLDSGLVPLGSDSVYNPAIIDPDAYGPQAAETGLKIYVSWHPSSNPNNQTDFEKNAAKMFDFEQWNWYSQSSYDAMSALTQGLQDLDGKPTGKKLMRKLRSHGFAADGVVGEGSVKFLRNGDRDITGFEDKIGAIVGVEEYEDENGEVGYRFVKVNE